MPCQELKAFRILISDDTAGETLYFDRCAPRVCFALSAVHSLLRYLRDG